MQRNQISEQIYYTGLIADISEPDQPSPPFKGSGWEASFIKERRYPPKLRDGCEIIINAKSWISAQRALNLIVSSLILYSGYPHLLEPEFIAHNNTRPEFLEPEYRKIVEGKFHSENNIPLACSIAAKASRCKKWVYALAKHKLSTSIYNVNPHEDLEPFCSPHLPLSEFPDDHVMFSYAIISAYSVIEDLGLDVRASQKKPSRIEGKWNPPIKKSLEKRLTASRVDLNEPILWIIRGPKRKIEQIRKVPIFTKAPWAKGLIRDSKISLIDAIAYSEWLRGRIASHGVKKLTKVLSPYDVVNVQYLARRLLLEILGFWRYHQKKKKI